MHFSETLFLTGNSNIEKLINFCKFNKFHYNWQHNTFNNQTVTIWLTITSSRPNKHTLRREIYPVYHYLKTFNKLLVEGNMQQSIEASKEWVAFKVLKDIFEPNESQNESVSFASCMKQLNKVSE
jgi:hypothetical protein